MKLSRNTTTKIRFLMDELLPPIIRDSKLFTIPFFKILYKNNANIFLNFKKNAPKLSKKEFKNLYKTINSLTSRQTDLNTGCEKEILKNIIGTKVLEVGCANAYLAKKIAKSHNTWASDIVLPKKLTKAKTTIKFKEANVEDLPFNNKEFDTVVCTHTLEHVQNISLAVKNLRRVTKKRLIIVVPKQRPYRSTFDLHLHFFPYPESLLVAMGSGGFKKRLCFEISGDLYYQEDF